jgi:hypothetical protein
LVPNTGTFITKKIGFYRKGAFVLARKTPIWAEEDLEFHHEMSDLYWEKDGFTGFHLGRYSISPKKHILNLVASTWIPWIPLSRPQVMQTIDQLVSSQMALKLAKVPGQLLWPLGRTGLGTAAR